MGTWQLCTRNQAGTTRKVSVTGGVFTSIDSKSPGGLDEGSKKRSTAEFARVAG
jgi:hypothetical protein